MDDIYTLTLDNNELVVVKPVPWPDYQKGYEAYSLGLAATGSALPNMGDHRCTKYLEEAFEHWGVPKEIFRRMTVDQVHDLLLSQPEYDEYGLQVLDSNGQPKLKGANLFKINQNLSSGVEMKEFGDDLAKKNSEKASIPQPSLSGPSAPITPLKTRLAAFFQLNKSKTA